MQIDRISPTIKQLRIGCFHMVYAARGNNHFHRFFIGGVNKPVIDIYSKNPYPANVLSNFTRCSFVFDGVHCGSIEGVLQALKVRFPSKTENPLLWKERLTLQKTVCSYANNKAKRQGSFLNFFNKERKLSWLGKPIDRNSGEYQLFLKRLFEARYLADPQYRQAIYDSRQAKLVHIIGKHDKSKTNLTEEEFLNMIMYLRKKYNGAFKANK